MMRLASLFPALIALAAWGQGDEELGRRIYQEGLLADRSAIIASSAGNPALASAAFRCASCHRASGFGGSEGGSFVPKVTAFALFGATVPTRTQLFRELYQEVRPEREWAKMRLGKQRPAYTHESLGIALSEGKDPSGRTLGKLMPRYQLGAADTANLVAYLKTLGEEPARGVSASELHLATVYAANPDMARKLPIQEVIRAFIRRKNSETKRLQDRGSFSLNYKDDFKSTWRRWVHHEWQLEGEPDTWAAQLAAFQREQPVFALVSGLGEGEWAPVQEFCEQQRLPGLFPNLVQPPEQIQNGYSFYFSQGPRAEAYFLWSQLDSEQAGEIVQIFNANGAAEQAVAWLAEKLPTTKRSASQFKPEKGRGGVPAETWVVWLSVPELVAYAQAWKGPLPRALYVSGTMLGRTRNELVLAPEWEERLNILEPYASSETIWPKSYEIRAWMRSRRLGSDHEVERFNTYFALSLLDDLIVHLAGQFSAEYLIERIEHETERMENPGIYPTLSLGPTQKTASLHIELISPH